MVYEKKFLIKKFHEDERFKFFDEDFWESTKIPCFSAGNSYLKRQILK